MADVAVSRLRIAAPPGRIAEARQRSEDALRLAANDEQRLFVLRQLDLGVFPVGASPTVWAERATHRLHERKMRAVYGAAAGAERTDAVWFHSLADARAHLLRLLAAGRLPSAWFWKLAVPDWRGLAPDVWFAALVGECAGDAEGFVWLARTVAVMLAEGQGTVLVAWLAAVRIAPPSSARELPAIGQRRSTQADSPTESVVLAGRARALVARLNAPTHTAFRTLVLAPSTPPAGRMWLTRFALAAAAPELAATAAIEDLAQAAVAHRAFTVENIAPVPETPRRTEPRSPLRRSETAAPVGPDRIAPDRRLPSPTPDRGIGPTANAMIEDGVLPKAPLDDIATPDTIVERASAAAGTLLLVRPLWRMGLGEWLARHPDRLADGFGRALLAHIAERMGAPGDDVLFAILGEFETADAELLTLWRIALDRWLRRTTRMKLAQVVRMRGWLARRDDGVDARFTHETADIRLRRHALDLDPGWVGWLGLVVRYHYADEPLS